MIEALVWLILCVIMGIIEVSTVSLVTIWFAFGAFISFILALFHVPIAAQVLVFALSSVLLMVFTRPLLNKFFKVNKQRTNADRVLDEVGKVIEDIDNTVPTGLVYALGKEWTARSDAGTIKAGTSVKILRIEGVKLWVIPVSV
jgi:membrane protein implicated in regulation of membrane protease activity